MSVPGACPRCGLGTVRVETTAWPSEAGPGRSVWVDEPVRCARGCVLTPREVQRLLVAVYEAPAWQPPLPFAVGGPEEVTA